MAKERCKSVVKSLILEKYSIDNKDYRAVIDSMRKVCDFAIENGGIFYANGWFKVYMPEKSSKFFNLKKRNR